MSVVTGILVWGFISLCGLPLAQEWGVIAFALNYIPFIGPLVATVLPTLFAVAQFDAWQNAILVFGCLNLIQFLVGSYLEPRIAGSIFPCRRSWCCSLSSSGPFCGDWPARSSASRS